MDGCLGGGIVRHEGVGGEEMAVLFPEVFSNVVVHTHVELRLPELQTFSWSKHHDDVCFMHGVGTPRYALLCHETLFTLSLRLLGCSLLS